MLSKTIKIRGKEVSENMIVEALKKHCGFDEPTPLEVGDVVVARNYSDHPMRVMVKNKNNRLMSIDVYGNHLTSDTGIFKEGGYRKIGRLSDFLPEYERDLYNHAPLSS